MNTKPENDQNPARGGKSADGSETVTGQSDLFPLHLTRTCDERSQCHAIIFNGLDICFSKFLENQTRPSRIPNEATY
jgi:hypothetical protein